jgi:hypothetical protein
MSDSVKKRFVTEVVSFYRTIAALSEEALRDNCPKVVLISSGLQVAAVQAFISFEQEDQGLLQGVIGDLPAPSDEGRLRMVIAGLAGDLAIERAKHSASKASVSLFNEAAEAGTRAIERQEGEVPEAFKEEHPGLSPASLVAAWRMEQRRPGFDGEAAGIEID